MIESSKRAEIKNNSRLREKEQSFFFGKS